MGTGIVAVAAVTLPVKSPLLSVIAGAAWALACVAFIVAVALTARHLSRDRGATKRYLLDPAMAPFFGAPAMASMTVGAGTLLVGSAVLGTHAAAVIDGVLWAAGTVLGLAVAVAVPAIAFTRHRVEHDAASPTWLMPVVPPMVSAATGALLIEHVPPALAQSLAIACFAMFGASALAAMLVISSVWNRLAHHQRGEAATVPTLWIVLGPLGQSVTAVGLLADHAPAALGVSQHTLTVFALLYGLPVFGFAMLWLAIAASITIDAARKDLPFSLGWWAFTFPVGTCVTAASSLTHHTGAALLGVTAVALYGLLLWGWGTSAWGTVRSWLRAPTPAIA
jgi:tellurite resistance protein TehA-like permease